MSSALHATQRGRNLPGDDPKSRKAGAQPQPGQVNVEGCIFINNVLIFSYFIPYFLPKSINLKKSGDIIIIVGSTQWFKCFNWRGNCGR
jgi:hypothetical protein